MNFCLLFFWRIALLRVSLHFLLTIKSQWSVFIMWEIGCAVGTIYTNLISHNYICCISFVDPRILKRFYCSSNVVFSCETCLEWWGIVVLPSYRFLDFRISRQEDLVIIVQKAVWLWCLIYRSPIQTNLSLARLRKFSNIW